MDATHTINRVAEMLWDLLNDDSSAAQFQADPSAALADQGMADVTPAELEAAYDQIADRLPPSATSNAPAVLTTARTMETGAPRLEAHPTSHTSAQAPEHTTNHGAPEHTSSQSTPTHHSSSNSGNSGNSGHSSTAHSAPAPHQSSPYAGSEGAHIDVHEPIPTVINNTYVTNVTNVSDDDVTNVTNQVSDNDVITKIYAEGDVDFDQNIDNHTVQADDGGVAVGDDLQNSAVNTGTNTGIIAGDDVELEDSVVGNGNTQVNDSEVGAFADHGDATNIETDGNVNTGSGDLVDVESDGDAQVVTGNGNDVSGDVDLTAQNTDGPVNVAVGDGNGQQALEDNSTEVVDSFNTDNSLEDVGNTSAEDSFNTVTQDNDTATTTVEDSFDTSVQDNDTATYEATSTYDDQSTYSDDDTMTFEQEAVAVEPDLYGDDSELDLDA